jgi:ABC-type multidrug transport system ATPase subunit
MLLILDEPLANLDTASQQSLLYDLRQVAGVGPFAKAAVIITSQHLYEIEAISAGILVLSRGKEVRRRERPHTYMEIWWGSAFVTKDQIATALGPLKPVSIKVETTVCFLTLPKGVKVSDVARHIEASGMQLLYCRDVTNSARVDLEIDSSGGDLAL